MNRPFRKIVLGFAVAALLGSASFSGMVYGREIQCDPPAAAGKSAPATPLTGPEGKFRIIWQISTQIEKLADAANDPAAMNDMEKAKNIADGYSINTLLGGSMMYWPGRPKQCQLNFKRVKAGDSIEVDGETFSFEGGGREGQKQCKTQLQEFVSRMSQAKDPAADIQIDALERVFNNIDLINEQKRGKSIWGVSLIGNSDFSYDKTADKVTMSALPRVVCVMNASGITLNGMMIYQEGNLQAERGKFLWIPGKNRRGELKFRKPRRDMIPENTHAFQKIVNAFDQAKVEVGGFRANIRLWREGISESLARELVNIPHFGGFNFEGGTGMLSASKKKPDHLIKGASWLLANTDRDISFLMPGYWDRDQVGNEEEIDTQIPRLRQLITVLNDGLNAKMKLPAGQNAICNNRLAFIVGSYGQPVRVKSLPMRRADGRLAGTVTGQIQLLSDIRKELCGS